MKPYTTAGSQIHVGFFFFEFTLNNYLKNENDKQLLLHHLYFVQKENMNMIAFTFATFKPRKKTTYEKTTHFYIEGSELRRLGIYHPKQSNYLKKTLVPFRIHNWFKKIITNSLP